MDGGSFSERVRRALHVIDTKDMTPSEMRNVYRNAVRISGITDAEREAVIAALEKRIRISAPREAKVLFGPKDAEARALLTRVHDSIAGEIDLSGNTVGAGVKTGGDMISGEVHVSVYISYKGQDRRHTTLSVLQRAPDTEPIMIVRLYQTGKEAVEQDLREEFPLTEIDNATLRYRENLMHILGLAERAS